MAFLKSLGIWADLGCDSHLLDSKTHVLPQAYTVPNSHPSTIRCSGRSFQGVQVPRLPVTKALPYPEVAAVPLSDCTALGEGRASPAGDASTKHWRARRHPAGQALPPSLGDRGHRRGCPVRARGWGGGRLVAVCLVLAQGLYITQIFTAGPSVGCRVTKAHTCLSSLPPLAPCFGLKCSGQYPASLDLMCSLCPAYFSPRTFSKPMGATIALIPVHPGSLAVYASRSKSLSLRSGSR